MKASGKQSKPTPISSCHRCNKIIYDQNKFGPVNGNIYHKQCFKCFVCDTSLTIKSYKTSQASISDKEVYCSSHAPKSKATNLPPPSKWNNNFSKKKEEPAPSAETSIVTIELPKSSEIKSVDDNFVTISGGRVAALTKKWNSRDNLLVETQNPNITSRTSSLTQELLVPTAHGLIQDQMNPLGSSSNDETIKSKRVMLHQDTNERQNENNLQRAGSKTKVIGNNLCIINYNKYFENIKKSNSGTERRQMLSDTYAGSSKLLADHTSLVNLTIPLKNDTDLSVFKAAESPKIVKKNVNVDNLLNDELSFYENFAKISENFDTAMPSGMNDHTALYSILNTKTNEQNFFNQAEQQSDEPNFFNTHLANESQNHECKRATDFNYYYFSGDETKRHFSSNDVEEYRCIPDNTHDVIPQDSQLTNKNRCKSDGVLMSHTEPCTDDVINEDNLIKILQNNIGRNVLQFKEYGHLKISYILRGNLFTVYIQSGEKLNEGKFADVYVKLMLLPESTRHQTVYSTDIVHNTHNPIWDKSFQYENIDLFELKSKYLYLSVKDHKMASELLSMGVKDEALKMLSLGEALVSLFDVLDGYWYEVIVPLREASEVHNDILSKDLQ